jgi:dTDP-4-dehydrorhamnose reductase
LAIALGHGAPNHVIGGNDWQGAPMHRVLLMGRASVLFDNLALTWQGCLPTFEASLFDSWAATAERIRVRRPEWIVYCGPAAVSSWESGATTCGDDHLLVGELARAAAGVDARLAVITSDRVFSGPAMFHDESEPTSSDERATSLRAIELAAMSVNENHRRALVIRTHVLGWSATGESFAEQIWHSLEERQAVELEGSVYATPILATDLAPLILRCFRAELHGVVHIGGAERTSPFRFGQELAAAAGFDRRLVRSNPADATPADAVGSALETSLASRRVRHEIDASLPLLRESIARFVDQANNGHRERLRGAADDSFSRAA